MQSQLIQAECLKISNRPIGFVAHRDVGGKFSVPNPNGRAENALLSAKKTFDAAGANARNPTRRAASALIAYEFHMGNIGDRPGFR